MDFEPQKMFSIYELSHKFNISQDSLLKALYLRNIKVYQIKDNLFISSTSAEEVINNISFEKEIKLSPDGFEHDNSLPTEYQSIIFQGKSFSDSLTPWSLEQVEQVELRDRLDELQLSENQLENKRFSSNNTSELMDNSEPLNSGRWLINMILGSLFIGLFLILLSLRFGIISREDIESYNLDLEAERNSNIEHSLNFPVENETDNSKSTPEEVEPIEQENRFYNLQELPPFNPVDQSDYLSEIIDDTLIIMEMEGYPTSSVSISLVEISSDYCCKYAGYQDQVRRFPASVVKLFWIAMLYGKYEYGEMERGYPISYEDEFESIHNSDNEASSRIVDAISNSESKEQNLDEKELEEWISQRLSLNEYFQRAGYNDINISQKTYPIPYLDMFEPQGPDSQLREYLFENGMTSFPVRNYLTTFNVARLLYEIESGNSISNDYSFEIKELMRHDNSPKSWKNIPYNSIEGFFGEYLPEEATILTKVGYTLDYGRQEASIITSADGRKRYILVVFANDSIFSDEPSDIFPKISRFIYDEITSHD